MTLPTTGRDLRWMWIASEVLLVALSIVSAQTLARLYSDTSFLAPMLFTIIVSHAVLIAMRWFGFGAVVTSSVSFIAVVLAIVATHYSSSAVAVLIPTGETVDRFQADLNAAGDVFNALQTPVPPITGFIVVGSICFWVLAVAADWAAFRLFSPGQAIVPAFAALVFVSLLGVDDNRIATTAALVAVAGLFVLAHRAANHAVQGVWLGSGPTGGYFALLIAGAIVAFVATAIGVLAGPAVPGADEAPLVEIGGEGREQSDPIEVISPLVQIQPRLIDQSDRVMFTVETNERAYWRIAALDVFDGSLWRSQGQFSNVDDGLDIAYPVQVPVTSINAVFDLRGLNVVWAPAPYLPVGIDNLSDVDLNYEAESATFIVDTKSQQVSDGLRYRVQAQHANFTPDSLRRLAASSRATIDPRYVALPGDYSPLARAEAERLTAGLTDPYAQALALQNYFRENFVYDIDVAKGHDIRRLEDFLTVQRGYCEQFAGTFASMARAIGLPSRVATGFTPGEPDPTNPNRYIVRGKHAHAWPEVWIAGAGWVAFEPTPGRGAPNGTEYTGAPESQASEPAEPDQDLVDTAEQASPLAAAPPTPSPSEQTQPAEPEPEPVVEPVIAQEPGSRLPLIMILAALGLVVWAIGVPALKKARERRHRDRLGDDTRRQITLTWSKTVDRLENLGYPPRSSETLIEFCDRIEREFSAAAPAFAQLTELTVAASYSAEAPTAQQLDRAQEFAATIEAAIDADQPWLVRSAYELDPRPLLRFRDPVMTRSDRLAAGATTIPDRN